MRLKKLAAGAALLGLSAQAMAQPACLTSAEAETVIQALLPGLIESVSERCAAFLPDNSNLIARSDALSERYTPAAETARDAAAPIVMRILDGDDAELPVDGDAGGELMLGMFQIGISVAMNDALDADSCPTADRIFTTLEPLPSRNFAGLLTLLIEIGNREDDDSDDDGPFAICETGTG